MFQIEGRVVFGCVLALNPTGDQAVITDLIELPDIEVFLADSAQSHIGAPDTTRLDGTEKV